MAHIVDNSNGFKVIFFTQLDLYCLGQAGICQYCHKVGVYENGTYYVATADKNFCPTCYKEWEQAAIGYNKDVCFEAYNFNTYKFIFNL